MRPWESVPAPSQRDGRWAETHHPATCSGFRRSGHDREFSRISAVAGFVRQLGQQRVAQSGPIHVALLGIGLAGQRTVNRSGFNLWFGWSVRSWESVPATPQQGRDSGPTSARGRTAGPAGRRIGLDPLPSNLGNHQDSCDVIGFVSQFFSSTSGALSSTSTLGRQSSCADDGRLARGDRRLAPKRTDGSRLAVSCMTIRILRAKESWLTGATGQERQPVPAG
jgi:hypothetical protein